MANKVVQALLNAPLPQMVEQMGFAIANAQRALDISSIALAKELNTTTVNFGGGRTPRSLLALGFTPTFYAFTETTIEAKIAFSMKQESEVSASAGVSVRVSVVAAHVEASYSRKFSFEASGSSSIATRLVSVPAPTVFLDYVAQVAQEEAAAAAREEADAAAAAAASP